MAVYTPPPSPSAPTKRRDDNGAARSASSAVPLHVAARVEARGVRLAALGYDSYRSYLASVHWAGVKARYRRSSLPQECFCGEADVHLHHLTYERLGRERLADLTPLCRRCHQLVHTLEWRGQIALDLEGFVLDAERAAQSRALLAALVAKREAEEERDRRAEQVQVLALPFAARLTRAVRAARKRRRNVSGHLRILSMFTRTDRSDEAMTNRLRKIEEIAYGWDGWADARPRDER